MGLCYFVTDLHGRRHRYERLFETIEAEIPSAVFIGGDLFPHMAGHEGVPSDFLGEYLGPLLEKTRKRLEDRYPAVFVILGNDDSRSEEEDVRTIARHGLWHYAHRQRFEWNQHTVYGYACVPPTPFLLKDWEKYDISRYTPHGCVSPEE
jgi:Icc-related predicted phosphoesterase